MNWSDPMLLNNMVPNCWLLDAILEVRRASGLNAKKRVLKAHPELQQLLRATYDQSIQYYVAARPSPTLNSKEGEPYLAPLLPVLKNLSTRLWSGTKAKQELSMAIDKLDYSGAVLATMILARTCDFGLSVKSINDVWPGLIPLFEVQLAKPFEEKHWPKVAMISPKIDGVRAIYRNGELWTRNGIQILGASAVTNVLKSLEIIQSEALVFDGELIVEGLKFDESSGLIRSNKSTSSTLVYNVFDCMNSPEMDLVGRYHRMRGWLNLIDSPHIQPVKHVITPEITDAYYLYQNFREQGYEGAMIKDAHAPYEFKRSWSWMKMKALHTFDCEVIGVERGTGKNSNAVGALVVDFNGKRVNVGVGMSDEERTLWWKNLPLIVGMTVEVACQEVTPEGSMRFPRLMRIREDKS
jgi:DNA ligase-1